MKLLESQMRHRRTQKKKKRFLKVIKMLGDNVLMERSFLKTLEENSRNVLMLFVVGKRSKKCSFVTFK